MPKTLPWPNSFESSSIFFGHVYRNHYCYGLMKFNIYNAPMCAPLCVFWKIALEMLFKVFPCVLRLDVVYLNT